MFSRAASQAVKSLSLPCPVIQRCRTPGGLGVVPDRALLEGRPCLLVADRSHAVYSLIIIWRSRAPVMSRPAGPAGPALGPLLMGLAAGMRAARSGLLRARGRVAVGTQFSQLRGWKGAPSRIRTCGLLLRRHTGPSAVLTCENPDQ